ncbi:MAG: hypothetical protein ACLFV6_13815 [Spirulinaceae cyanobacterium]
MIDAKAAVSLSPATLWQLRCAESFINMLFEFNKGSQYLLKGDRLDSETFKSHFASLLQQTSKPVTILTLNPPMGFKLYATFL